MMSLRLISLVSVSLALTACVAEPPTEALPVSEQIADVARPGQDLSTVQLRRDGCYWWLYSGPVEDTLIPLETREGRGICARGPRGSTADDS